MCQGADLSCKDLLFLVSEVPETWVNFISVPSALKGDEIRLGGHSFSDEYFNLKR